MKMIFSRRPRALIPLMCYGAAAVVWLLLCAGLLLSDVVSRGTGKMTAQEMELSQFELVNLESAGTSNALQATSPDPQFIWVNPDGRTVRSVTLTVQHTNTTGEMSLYYIEEYGQAFDREMRVFPIRGENGRYVFTLPAADVYALRLDPCSVAQRLDGVSIAFNTDCPVWRYVVPSWQQLFDLLLYPGLAACALNILLDGQRQWKARRKNEFFTGQPGKAENKNVRR